MDRADESRAEHVREIGGHGGKSAAVYRGDDAKRGRENRHRLQARESGRDGVANHAKPEEDKIGCLAADRTGKRRPKKSAADVEQREEADETTPDRGRQRFLRFGELRETGRRIAEQSAGE